MQKSNLLINEPPLQVIPSLALLVGLNEAIVLQQVHYWINNPRNAGRVDPDGNKWVYNTYAQWQEDNFPFWSVDKVQRLFLSLENQKVLISAQFDAKSRDMTKFYRIDHEQICMMHSLKFASSNTAKLHDVKMNTESTAETTFIEEEDVTQNVFTVYSQEIGTLTAKISYDLEDWEKMVGPVWVTDAIQLASKHNARNWAYCEAILKRWKAQGNQNDKKAAKTSSASMPKGVKAVEEWLQERENNGE